MKRKIFSILFRLTAWMLPDSYSYINLFGKSYHIKVGLLYRRFLANHILKNCGKQLNIERTASFSKDLIIGDFSGIGANTYAPGNLKIGKYCMLGPEVVFYTKNHSFSRTDIPMCEQGFSDIKPIIIEDDCWIGRRVIILPGVTIGKGSIIGAGAVVTKDIPSYSVAVGNPARVVKSRLDNSIRKP